MQYDQDDVQSMALCAWKEARGDGDFACVLVMHVIYNRANRPGNGFPNNIHDAVYQKNQFTSMSVPSDPEFNLQPSSADFIYATCLQAAPGVLTGGVDPTHGALFYANEATETSGWYYQYIIMSGKHPILLTYGHHTFRA